MKRINNELEIQYLIYHLLAYFVKIINRNDNRDINLVVNNLLHTNKNIDIITHEVALNSGRPSQN